MVKLSGFADEISQDLGEQLDTIESLGLKYFEFRGVWDKNVLALDQEELAKVKADASGGISRVGPVGVGPAHTLSRPAARVLPQALQNPHLAHAGRRHRLGGNGRLAGLSGSR